MSVFIPAFIIQALLFIALIYLAVQTIAIGLCISQSRQRSEKDVLSLLSGTSLNAAHQEEVMSLATWRVWEALAL